MKSGYLILFLFFSFSAGAQTDTIGLNGKTLEMNHLKTGESQYLVSIHGFLDQ